MGSIGSRKSNGQINYSQKSLKTLGNILETSNYIDEIEDIRAELIKRERIAENIDTKYPIQKMIDKADALIFELRKNY